MYAQIYFIYQDILYYCCHIADNLYQLTHYTKHRNLGVTICTALLKSSDLPGCANAPIWNILKKALHRSLVVLWRQNVFYAVKLQMCHLAPFAMYSVLSCYHHNTNIFILCHVAHCGRSWMNFMVTSFHQDDPISETLSTIYYAPPSRPEGPMRCPDRANAGGALVFLVLLWLLYAFSVYT